MEKMAESCFTTEDFSFLDIEITLIFAQTGAITIKNNQTKVTHANGAPKMGRSFIFTHVINMIQQCGTQADGQQCDDVTLKQGWNKCKQMKNGGGIN